LVEENAELSVLGADKVPILKQLANRLPDGETNRADGELGLANDLLRGGHQEIDGVGVANDGAAGLKIARDSGHKPLVVARAALLAAADQRGVLPVAFGLELRGLGFGLVRRGIKRPERRQLVLLPGELIYECVEGRPALYPL
jgi:hypothetical protein